MAKRLTWKAIASAVISLGTIPVLIVTRGYSWPLAVPAACAIGVLAYMAISTVERSLGAGRHFDGEAPTEKKEG